MPTRKSRPARRLPAMTDLPLRQIPGQVAQRLHPVVEHARDNQPRAPVIEISAQIVQNMRCSAPPACGKLDMEGSNATREVVSLTRPRAQRVLGNHLYRPLDERGVQPALQSAKLPRRTSQDVSNVLCCGLGELMIQGRRG
jgi:hypothetical protein